MMNFLKKTFLFTNKYFKENLLRHILIVGIILIISGIGAFFAVKSLPESVLGEIYAQISEIFQSKDVFNSDGTLSFGGIFLNNLQAGFLISILGIIPFIFLPVFYVVLNSSLVGALLAIVGNFTEESVLMILVKYILPHGIFEIPALIIEGAMGIKLCAFLCRKIFGKAKEESFLVHIKGFVGIFVYYIIPLLLVAAFIEAVVLSAIYL